MSYGVNTEMGYDEYSEASMALDRQDYERNLNIQS